MRLKLKRHYRLFLMLALVAAVLIVGLGDERIVAYSVQSSDHQFASAAVLDSMAQASAHLATTGLLSEPASPPND